MVIIMYTYMELVDLNKRIENADSYEAKESLINEISKVIVSLIDKNDQQKIMDFIKEKSGGFFCFDFPSAKKVDDYWHRRDYVSNYNDALLLISKLCKLVGIEVKYSHWLHEDIDCWYSRIDF